MKLQFKLEKMRHYSNQYSHEISQMGYAIQVAEGIQNPSKGTLEQLEKEKTELKIKMEEFRSKEPENYANSFAVDFYKKHCNEQY